VAYVAATRARDLLVVPAVGDDPFVAGWEAATDGWVAPVHRAVYPPAERRRRAQEGPGCPALGEDSVLERPERETPGRDNVRPGLHAFESGSAGYGVVWWDPRRLGLDVQPVYGLRREDLIQDPGPETVEADRTRYEAWAATRRAAQERGAQPSLRVHAATDRARATPDDEESFAREVTLVTVTPAAPRPGGPRFGTLVHAALATVALDAGPAQIAEGVFLQARILGAPAAEVDAATAAVTAALAHPLMARVRDAWRAGRCRRETPVAWRQPDGALVEGVLDLAFEDAGGWTVVDFKTDAEIAAELATYRRQVRLYASIVARATGTAVTPVLMQV
jgi:ATP-dependent helicase/nuclease subunit A